MHFNIEQEVAHIGEGQVSFKQLYIVYDLAVIYRDDVNVQFNW